MIRFYRGWDAFRATPLERAVMLANMDGVLAEEVLRERGGSLNNKQMYSLTLLATGDKKQAERAKSRRIMDELRQGLKPDV